MCQFEIEINLQTILDRVLHIIFGAVTFCGLFNICVLNSEISNNMIFAYMLFLGAMSVYGNAKINIKQDTFQEDIDDIYSEMFNDEYYVTDNIGKN